MKIRKTVAALMAAAALTLPASAVDVLLIHGENVWEQSSARLVEDTTYVSLRAVTGLLAPEMEISWVDGTACVRRDGLSILARPGDTWMMVNGEIVHIPYGVLLEDGRTMVPVRALTEALGGQTEWDRETGITLTMNGQQPKPTAYTAEDLEWLARIISAESRGEPLQGKIAVGTVVLNRVASDEFPNTIHDVIFDDKWGVQFEPVANGTVYNEPTEESVLAAKMCLDGARAAGDSLYFLAPELTDNHWIMENQEYVTTIGCHWFYR